MLSVLVLAFLAPVQPQIWFGGGVDIHVGVPTVRFEAEPPLVIVSPGVMVVEDSDSEVFFVDDYYWTSSRGRWYRTRDYRGGWAPVTERRVPGRISRVTPGRYRHFRGGRRYVRGPGHRGPRGYRQPSRHDRRDGRYRDDRHDRHDRHDRRRRGDDRHHGRGDRRHGGRR